MSLLDAADEVDLLERRARRVRRVGGLESSPELRPDQAFAEARNVRIRALVNPRQIVGEDIAPRRPVDPDHPGEVVVPVDQRRASQDLLRDRKRIVRREGSVRHCAGAQFTGTATKRTSPWPLETSSNAGFFEILLRGIDRLGDVARMFDRLMIDLLDHIAWPQSPFRGRRAGLDGRHDHALHAVLDLEGLAGLVAESGKFHPQRLGDSVLLQQVIIFGGERGLFFSVLEAPERHCLVHFLAAANDDDLDLPADRHRGHETRKIPQFLDLLAVEFDDHVARHQPRGLCRALLVDARDQGAARRP